MADSVKQILGKLIQLSDSVIKEASSFKPGCDELKSKTETLAGLLKQAGRASSELYERPARRIIDDTEQVLEKALSLIRKCRANGRMKRVFTIIPAAAFRIMSSQLESSIGDFSWLLRVSSSDAGHIEYLGMPPIAADKPILCLIWEHIAILSTGSMEDRSVAAESLVSLTRESDGFGKLIIEEGGVLPLLKLVKEGTMEGQEKAANAIGLLGNDEANVEHLIARGVCSVLAKILKEGPMKVQATVAWTVSELVANNPKSQDVFAQHNIIPLLVGHLAFETVQEHSKYAITSHKTTSIHAVVTANSSANVVNKVNCNSTVVGDGDVPNNVPKGRNGVNNEVSVAKTNCAGGNGKQNNLHHHHHQHNHSGSGVNHKSRELEDPATKAQMKAMAAKALWLLAKDNSAICRVITESRALLCFAVLLEKRTGLVSYYSAMALMEITAVAEEHAELRRSAFKPNSPACKAVVDQLLRVIEKHDSDLLVPCIKAIGNLARIFRAKEARMIDPLVKLLDQTEAVVCVEAAIALTKFACTENYLHIDHSKTIIDAGGERFLIQIAYCGETINAQSSALRLLCYIAMHLPDRDELAQADVLNVLKWASKQRSFAQDELLSEQLFLAKCALDMYQCRTTR